jgi:hypothetical protein
MRSLVSSRSHAAGNTARTPKANFLRFAAPRHAGLEAVDDFIDLLCFNTEFTRENTTLVRSDTSNAAGRTLCP